MPNSTIPQEPSSLKKAQIGNNNNTCQILLCNNRNVDRIRSVIGVEKRSNKSYLRNNIFKSRHVLQTILKLFDIKIKLVQLFLKVGGIIFKTSKSIVVVQCVSELSQYHFQSRTRFSVELSNCSKRAAYNLYKHSHATCLQFFKTMCLLGGCHGKVSAAGSNKNKSSKLQNMFRNCYYNWYDTWH